MKHNQTFKTVTFENFTQGILSVFSFGSDSLQYKPPLRLKKTDCEALYSDWEKVGFDMSKSIEGYKDEKK